MSQIESVTNRKTYQADYLIKTNCKRRSNILLMNYHDTLSMMIHFSMSDDHESISHTEETAVVQLTKTLNVLHRVAYINTNSNSNAV